MTNKAQQFNEWLAGQAGRTDIVGEFARQALADEKTRGYGDLIGYWVTWARNDEMECAAYRAIDEFDGTTSEAAANRFPVQVFQGQGIGAGAHIDNGDVGTNG